MNDYIIDPWFFYWMNTVEAITFMAGTVFVASVIATSIAVILAIISSHEDDLDTKEMLIRFSRKVLKSFVPVLVVSSMLLMFVPSKTTMIQMAIASQTTYSNVEKVKKSAKELVDYVIEKSKELSK